MYKLLIIGHRAHARKVAAMCDSLTDKTIEGPRITATDQPDETSSYRILIVTCHPSKMESLLFRMAMAFRQLVIVREPNDEFKIEIE